MSARKVAGALVVNLCRLVVALTFIFSGYVKAIDPLGTHYKLQDYVEALGLAGCVPDYITVVASVLLGGLEFCLGVLLLLSYIGHNMSVFYAVGIILLLKIFHFTALMNFVEANGLNYGIILLTIAILLPLANGRITVPMMIDTFKSPVGILALLAGIFAAAAGGWGVNLLKDTPTIVTSLVIGTMVGVFFFKGIAVGPLIAGGITYLILSLTKLFH